MLFDIKMIRALVSQQPMDVLRQIQDMVVDEIASNYKQQAEAMRKVTQQDLAGPAVDVKLHVSDSGATSSHVPLRYDLIPRALLDAAAKRYTEGAKKHGERGYQKGLADYDFIINRINHITEHWNKLFHRCDDMDEAESPIAHLGAILWGIGFLCELTENEGGKYIFGRILDGGRVRRG